MRNLPIPAIFPVWRPPCARVDPSVIVALNETDFERLYSAPAMATWVRGADRL